MVARTMDDISCFYPLSLKIKLHQPFFFLRDNVTLQSREAKVFHAYLFSSQT